MVDNASTSSRDRSPPAPIAPTHTTDAHVKHSAPNIIAADDSATAATSAPVRALSAQLKELRRRHRDEVAALRQALAVAQGENLALRRRLAAYE
jgi:hypothetical protein